jgi:hypothetical protein
VHNASLPRRGLDVECRTEKRQHILNTKVNARRRELKSQRLTDCEEERASHDHVLWSMKNGVHQ